jgi:hypothetical protein
VSETSIDLPPGRTQITGLALARSKIESITVDPENPFLRVSGDFLVDFRGDCLVRYFGNASEIVIPADIERIEAGCFAGCGSVSSVSFAPG